MLQVSTFILASTFLFACRSFSGGSGTCDASNLGNGPTQMGATKASSSNFVIGLAGGQFKPGTANTIWINRTGGTAGLGFRGVLLYVTDAQNNRIGTLTGNANTHGKACTGNAQSTSTITHNTKVSTNSAFLAKQPFTWNAPSNVNGPVMIHAIAYETGTKMFNVPTPISVSQNPNATAPPTTTGPTTTLTTVTGPLVDHYCWTTLNGIALDTKANLKQDPYKHTVHCLVEVSQCKNSGFAIVEKKSGASQYTIQYDLDSKGNNLASAEMLKLPAGSNGPRWKETGFVVTATGTVDSSKTPPVLQVRNLTAQTSVACWVEPRKALVLILLIVLSGSVL